ncbi:MULTISPECIES: sigma-70 family RNA polymerase sigma factor [unclassified Variovorax]|uniref:sigma-70 family RNA polymerase sigma factor n=1 Tax=unclassified Variovorax TaxID=663243 RepID=UPI00257867BE|nr:MULTISPECIES: sigma-70 family RNA polymerase sigma factor [unclassified Variovorax]MDM0085994.1 sigma-70 family RNA polymerase sigma factor [Variovorax sp. J22G40]MDM0145749.1 sigma-70 family RNA polymerase sigma factor [Variovorax sp. J2P1-31]
MKRTTSGSPQHLHDAEAALHDLFVRGQAGDAVAYRAFLVQLGAHLRGFLGRRLFGWPDEVEDLVQECLIAMHNQRHTYQSDQPLTAWVHAIARYKMIDLLRAKGSREALHIPLDDELEVFADSATEASDARRDLSGLLDTLPDRHRLPIVHVKLEGLSIAEAAEKTGMSESAVKVGIHRGLKALMQKIKDAR